ncbi:hypothetical protein RIF29_39977 [Crotalaria pallida]|uniref:Uncharacterized protein n=1 Tax=Crotalaria pallida TaxID=3830 RepID=A0AAN9E4P7_CROPI
MLILVKDVPTGSLVYSRISMPLMALREDVKGEFSLSTSCNYKTAVIRMLISDYRNNVKLVHGDRYFGIAYKPHYLFCWT